jgi:hypothetical protein
VGVVELEADLTAEVDKKIEVELALVVDVTGCVETGDSAIASD